jgi:hypothetical protein
MRQMRIYLVAALAAALAAAHAANPGVARAEYARGIWTISELGELCFGKCSKGYLCCTIIVAPPA